MENETRVRDLFAYIIYLFISRHLGRNPFSCDCNLRWLSDYLHKNPIETSAARCESPKKLQKRRIDGLSNDKFKCKFYFYHYCILFGCVIVLLY